MRSSFLPPLLGYALALALPSAAAAQDYSPFRQPAEYDALPVEGTTAAVKILNTASVTDSYVAVQLPFVFFFYGLPYDQVNMSSDGFITFGTDPTGQGKAASAYANQLIPTADAPTGLVAAWWDDNTCAAGTMKTQTFGEPGQQWFVLEWDGCTRLTSILRMQIWLQQGSPIIRVYYGSAITGTSAHSATVGVEDPATYDKNGKLLTTGGVAGTYGLLDDKGVPLCTSTCDRANWPSNTMIQYGRSKIPDLQPGRLRTASLEKGDATITAIIENTIDNPGRADAVGITWDHYLSEDDRLDETDLFLNCRHAPLETVPGADSSSTPRLTASTSCTFDLPKPGNYRFCTLVDPANAITEASELNNSLCSDPFVIGSDLVGSISIVPKSGLGSRTPVHVYVANAGTDPTGQFEYTITWKDCDGLYPDRHAYTGTLALAGGKYFDGYLDLYLDSSIKARSLCAELVIDEANAVHELFENNNVSSTCVGAQPICTTLQRPDLVANQLFADLPHGCFFDDTIGLELEICNKGAAAATNFGVLFGFDENTIVTLDDTRVLAIPESCAVTDPVTGLYRDDPSLCHDLGGGQPSCIQGTCHPPCAQNTDCGDLGLECLDDPLLEVDGVKQNSCQFALPGGTCKWIQATADVPFIDTRAADGQHPGGIPFADGGYYLGVIVDSVGLIVEDDKNNNKKHMDTELACWTQRADFEVVELDSVSRIGAGEPFPVHRKMRNNGVVGGPFSYRYVLSSNQTPSEFDIPLEVLQLEDGQIVGSDRTASDALEPLGIVDRSDVVLAPANTMPGTYYLGVIIDPEDQIFELTKENNTAVWCDPQSDGTCESIPVEVVPSSFRIVTQSLPIATVGQSYDVQLLANGGVAGYQWRLSGGGLPAGLALDPSGLLHGAVVEPGDYPFEVTVNSGARSTSATFAIRAIPAGGPLAITTSGLPMAYVGVGYVAELGASGGASPYAWSCDGLPTWARLDGDIVRGTPATAADAVSVICTVIDAHQQSVSAAYALQVMTASNLRITTTSFASFDFGVASSATIEAAGGSGSYRWAIDGATLPDGLQAVEAGNTGAIEGTPLVCGHFLVGVVVTDTVSAVTDSAELPLVVACDAPRLTTRDLPMAVRGQDYPETQLTAERAVEFAVVSGDLPRGLALSKSGVLSGTVAIDADAGDHHLAIELRDAAGGIGEGALTLTVQSSGPEVVLVDEVTKGGCSASGGGSAAGLLPLVALLALLGSRRRRVGKMAGTMLVVSLAAVAPATALAAQNGYGMVSWDIQYERLEGATPATSCSSYPADTCISPAIPLPFTFSFFGQDYNQVRLDSNGLLHFISTSSVNSNAVIPNTATPNGFIAPWWDDLEIPTANDLRYLVRGTAPNREFVVEWLLRWYADSHTGNDLSEMQVSLYEDGAFSIRWGSPGLTGNHSATVGIEDATGSSRSVSILPCSDAKLGATAGTCVQADWETYLTNKEAFFSTGVNLAIVGTSTAPEAMTGFEQEFQVTARNMSVEPVSAAIELFISEDQEISPDDYLIGRTPILDFAAGAKVQDGVVAPLPAALVPGPYYLLARVDPDGTVEETREYDNEGGAFKFVVVPPMPDLTIQGITSPSSGSTGSWITVDLDVINRGNVGVQGVPYVIVLSDNDVITNFDRVIHRGLLDIGWNTSSKNAALVELPADIPAGVYHLGAQIDPENSLIESNEQNNVHVSERPITITTNGLWVVTQLPSLLQIGAPYCIALEAEGGDGVYTWSLVEGRLPPGLEIDPGGQGDSDGAWLCGAPTNVGIYDFALEVASGGVTQRTEASLEVIAVPVQLGVATTVLPIGSFNVPYEAGLSANGGRAPYRWELLSGELPAGLVLDEDGLVYGMPLVDGQFSFEVQVHDGDGQAATASIHLGISSPGRITCSTRTLGAVEVGSKMVGRLLAGGGTGAYVWKSVRTQRFGDSGAQPLADEEGPPPGVELRASGGLEGTVQQIGQYLWTVEVSDEVIPGNADTCTISLEVLPGPGLTITTTAMPVALVDEEYSVQLQAAGGDGNYRWTLLDSHGLPAGLGLGETGIVSGTLGTADLEEKESRTWSFLVEVRDGQNNSGTGVMAVTLTTRKDLATVTRRTETTESGCSTGGGDFGLVALGLVVFGLRRRR